MDNGNYNPIGDTGGYNINPPQQPTSVITLLCYGKKEGNYYVVPNFINMCMILQFNMTNSFTPGSNNPINIIALMLLYSQIGIKIPPFNMFQRDGSSTFPQMTIDQYVKPISLATLKTDLLSFVNSLCP